MGSSKRVIIASNELPPSIMKATEEIKARLDLVDLISETVNLKKAGKNYSGYCPFHDNKRTPSFVVFPETQTWKCFGECSEGGDIFNYVMKKEGWDFKETLDNLALRAGVTLTAPTPQQKEQTEEHERLRQLLEDAVLLYRHNLYHTPNGKETLEYLYERGLDDATIETWGLGYAPNTWDAALTHFTQRGFTLDELVAAGLITKKENGRTYDRFRHRFMIPIRDDRGRMAGFGARALSPDELAKYLNSPQTPLFNKSNLLYGLDQARKAIRSADQVVIVEGYLDVIALHQHGFSNVVSPMGTALTETQMRLLKRRTRNIVLALDADAAGNKATLRGLEIAREIMDREQEIGFDARGLLQQEARLQADIRVTTLPEGMDPDEVVQRNPDDWTQILEAAKPIVEHVMDTLVADRDVDDPKVKTEIAQQVLPLIEDVADAIERETYRQRLARVLRVNERALVGTPQPRAPNRRTRRVSAPRPAVLPRTLTQPTSPRQLLHKLEAYCLGVFFRKPDILYLIDRALRKNQLPPVNQQDFQSADHQMLLTIVRGSLEQEFAKPTDALIGNLPIELGDVTDDLLAITETLDPNPDRVLETTIFSFLRLRKLHVNQAIEQLQFLMQDAQEEGNMFVREYLEQVQANRIMKGYLDKAEGQRYTLALLTQPSQDS